MREFFEILELALPDKINTLFFGILIGIDFFIVPEFWNKEFLCIAIYNAILLMAIIIIVINYIEIKSYKKNYKE